MTAKLSRLPHSRVVRAAASNPRSQDGMHARMMLFAKTFGAVLAQCAGRTGKGQHLRESAMKVPFANTEQDRAAPSR